MKMRRLHDWNLTPKKAAELQLRLRERLSFEPYKGTPGFAAGADCAYDVEKKKAIAAVVLFAVPSLREVERVSAVVPLDFPYVPGLLSFREAPALLAAFRKLRNAPDVAFFDGHGTAHPRRFGLACHMGLWLDVPTVGIAKSVLVGTHRTPAQGFGSTAPLVHDGDVVGAAFRAAEGASPVYVSPGHRIDLKSSLRLTRAVSDGKRIPAPTRAADRWVGELERALGG